VSDWDAMTNLPKALREQLRKNFTLQSLKLVRLQGARDITQKFLWRLNDGSLIESVLIPANPALYGEGSDRHTLCVSTQVGCAYGCRFCASGLEGFKRNLGAEEIVEQIVAVERWHAQQPPSYDVNREEPLPRNVAQVSKPAVSRVSKPTDAPKNYPQVNLLSQPADVSASANFGATAPKRIEGGEIGDTPGLETCATSISTPQPKQAHRLINNLVIMGMGEPLANYDNLLRALTILNAPWGGGIGARKITVSTSGLAPQIRKLADEPLQCRLAISLHGATDEVRDKIMPVNRKYPLSELIPACEYYQRKRGGMITFEYILIAGVNDHISQVKPLAELAGRLHAKVNLIPYNHVEGLPWERPTEQAQENFLVALERQKIPATLRREKGHDIDAACGQLRLKTERELAVKS
jgi:adenine C2-methylase RlmN of 23S rRNA A2503 and tRNA A37